MDRNCIDTMAEIFDRALTDTELANLAYHNRRRTRILCGQYASFYIYNKGGWPAVLASARVVELSESELFEAPNQDVYLIFQKLDEASLEHEYVGRLGRMRPWQVREAILQAVRTRRKRMAKKKDAKRPRRESHGTQDAR